MANLEVRLIKFYAKRGGFATSETKSYRTEIHNLDTGESRKVTEYPLDLQYIKPEAEEWAKLLGCNVVAYTEERKYTTELKKHNESN